MYEHDMPLWYTKHRNSQSWFLPLSLCLRFLLNFDYYTYIKYSLSPFLSVFVPKSDWYE